MNRTKISKGQRIIHDLSQPLRKRLEARKVCGPYVFTPPKTGVDEERFFYLEGDFMPSLRWQWCDHIATRMRHTGWFCDEFQDQTIRGIVMRLPHGKGFLAAWSMGEGMVSMLGTYIYECDHSAAHAADSWAERIAQNEREKQEEYKEEAA